MSACEALGGGFALEWRRGKGVLRAGDVVLNTLVFCFAAA